MFRSGGQGRNRTADASLFRAALYQLSYLAFVEGSRAGNPQYTSVSGGLKAFELLRGRHVIASGRRCQDLAVRLFYAEVDVATEPDLDRALTVARADDCDVVANYTAFRDVRRALGVAR